LIGTRLGGFELEALIGRGAFATVYRAEQVQLRRRVAVKVLDPLVARDPAAARRFEEEARRAAALDHPSIAPVYDAGSEAGHSYLAMRLIDGWSLAAEVQQSCPLPPDRLVEITTALTQALDYAHGQGVIHRDVKPDNVLLEQSKVWLVDFGIAATTQTVGQYTTGAIGTAQYMAPEQAQPGPIDGRADLYSLGCVIYECLTGSPPFQGDNVPTLLVAHALSAIPSIGDPAIDAFMERALAKDPVDRFATGAQMVQALQVALGATPTLRRARSDAPARGRRGRSRSAPGENRRRARSPRATTTTRRARTTVAIVSVLALVAVTVLVALRPWNHPPATLGSTRLCIPAFCMVMQPDFSRNATYSNSDILALNHARHPNELVKYGLLTSLTPHLGAAEVVEQVLIPDRLRFENATSSLCPTNVTSSDHNTMADGYACFRNPAGGTALLGTYFQAWTGRTAPTTALALSVTDEFEVLPGASEDAALQTMFASMRVRSGSSTVK
jgi:serine/threonine protein kinase